MSKLKFLIFPIVFITISTLYINLAVNRVNFRDGGPKLIEIKSGMGVLEIGNLLESEGLINSSTMLYLYVRLRGYTLEAGSYEIPSNLSLSQVVERLRHGTSDVRLTFIEGTRTEEFAFVASEKLQDVKYEDFVKLVENKNLDGYLFPDTYFVKKDISTDDLVKLLNETFKVKTKKLFAQNNLNLTEKEILTLASIVEREEPDTNERPVVAGILMSRYKNGELLGADATVQYIFGVKGNWWPKDLTQEQLESENPFNTRKVSGLPPRPICNPSLSAIEAVLNYQTTDYKYYLHDKKAKVHYAKTLEEHERNRIEYLGS